MAANYEADTGLLLSVSGQIGTLVTRTQTNQAKATFMGARRRMRPLEIMDGGRLQHWAHRLNASLQEVVAWEAEFRTKYPRYNPANHGQAGFSNRSLPVRDIRETVHDVMAAATLHIPGAVARAVRDVYQSAINLNRVNLVDGNSRRRRDERRRESDVVHFHNMNAVDVTRNVRRRFFNGSRTNHPRNGI